MIKQETDGEFTWQAAEAEGPDNAVSPGRQWQQTTRPAASAAATHCSCVSLSLRISRTWQTGTPEESTNTPIHLFQTFFKEIHFYNQT